MTDDPLGALDELEALLDSARTTYQDLSLINPDGTDLINPRRRYGPTEASDKFRNYCAHIQHMTAELDALREAAINQGLTRFDLNNRQLASALGVSHPTIARRRRELPSASDESPEDE